MTARARGDAFAHCEALVREADGDRFFATLFAPAAHRADLFALYAFHVEIGRVRALAREPLAGEIRLQWWRDALAGVGRGAVSANPVAAALLEAAARRSLDREQLLGLIDARSAELDGEPVASMLAFERRAGAAEKLVIALAAAVLGRTESTIDTAADHAGSALGMTTALRDVAREASRGRCDLPRDVLAHRGAALDDIHSGRSTAALSAALGDVRAAVRDRLDRLRSALPDVPGEALPAFLPVALVPGYLAVTQRADFEPFRTVVDLPQWRKQWMLWRASRQPARIAGG